MLAKKETCFALFSKIFFTQEYTRYTAKQSVCVKYAGAVKQKVWNEAENRERDWGETRPTRPKGEAGALLRHALPISLLIFAWKVARTSTSRLSALFILSEFNLRDYALTCVA